jgi:hypothetical protein
MPDEEGGEVMEWLDTSGRGQNWTKDYDAHKVGSLHGIVYYNGIEGRFEWLVERVNRTGYSVAVLRPCADARAGMAAADEYVSRRCDNLPPAQDLPLFIEGK